MRIKVKIYIILLHKHIYIFDIVKLVNITLRNIRYIDHSVER